MKLVAKNKTEERLLAYLDANASEALREKIAALPNGDTANLGDAYRYIREEARKLLGSKDGMVEDEVVFGWLVHYYEDEAAAAVAKAAKAKERAKAAVKERSKPAKKKIEKKGTSKKRPAQGASFETAKPAAATGPSECGTSCPDPAARPSHGASLGAPAEETASAAESGFSFVLFAADEKGGAA